MGGQRPVASGLSASRDIGAFLYYPCISLIVRSLDRQSSPADAAIPHGS